MGYPKTQFGCEFDARNYEHNQEFIKSALRNLEIALHPHHNNDFVLTEIEMMDGRGFQKETPDAMLARHDTDWIEDLAQYPRWLIEKAVKNWRDTTYPPPTKAGQLMQSVKSEFADLSVCKGRAESILELLESR